MPRNSPPFRVLHVTILSTRGKVSCVKHIQGPEAHLSFWIWKNRRAFWQGMEGYTISGATCNTNEQNQREKQFSSVSFRGKQEILLMVIWLTCFSKAMSHYILGISSKYLHISWAHESLRISTIPLCPPSFHLLGSLTFDKDRLTE